MHHLLNQFLKLLRVKLFFAETLLRAFTGHKRSKTILTELYMKSKLSDLLWSDMKLRRSKLIDVFPGAQDKAVEVYLQRQSIVSGVYDPSTEYLVSPLELSTIAAIAKALAPAQFFEIGTYKGWTLANVALNLPASTKIYSLDQHRHQSSDERVREILKAPNIKLLTGNSFNFDFRPFEGKMDLVFIDGGHDYETVKNDTQVALKLVSPRGTILWHDYNLEHPGVYRFINELARELDLKLIETTSIVAYRKG